VPDAAVGKTSGCPGKWHYNVAFGLLMLAVVGLGVRLWLLMRDRRADALKLAHSQQRMVIPLPARAGNIYARTRGRYVLLAGSRQLPLCYIDPGLLADDELADTAIQVGEALGEDPVEIQYSLLWRRKGRYVPVKRGLSDKEVSAIRALGLPSVGINYEWRRDYPNDDLAATVVGFRRHDGMPGGGLELTQQGYLAALSGKRVVLADARRRAIWPLPELSRTPRDGKSIFLCLDAVIQRYLQDAVHDSVQQFSAKWGTGLVVNPHTGEILAMCSVPTFNPNEYYKSRAPQQTNRAVSVPYEPGSVFKPLMAAAAVNSGVVTYQTQIFCENGVYYAHRGGKIGDHGQSYGTITLGRGVVISSNICLAKMGEIMGNARQFAALHGYGFGKRTGIELGGESPGIVRDLHKWDGYSLRRVPFGQEVSCTALQLTMAFCSIANGGLLVKPRLVEQVMDSHRRVIWTGKTEVVRRVLKRRVADETLGVMQEVIESGTGKACRLDRWTCFGKTGTAQIPGPGGYVPGAYVGSFVGGAPTSKPRIICLISIYWPDKSKGYYGGKVAAPYVKQVLEKTLVYLNVPPDKGRNVTAASARPGRLAAVAGAGSRD